MIQHHNSVFEAKNGDENEALDGETMAARLRDAQAGINDLDRLLVDDESIKAEWGPVDDQLAHLENDVVNMI